jgi:AcrR family transcriptional regulator
VTPPPERRNPDRRTPRTGRSGRPGPTPSLSTTDITSAAVVIADRDGLDAVTMRSVAAALHVSAPGLYRYVASRDELVAHMVDAVSARLEHPVPSGDGVQDLVTVARHQLDLYRAHPWLVRATATPTRLGPHVLDHLEWGLAALEPVTAPLSAKFEAIALATAAAALFSSSGPGPGPDGFAQLDARRHPHVVAALSDRAPTPPAPHLFERAVEGLLRGVLG